MKAPQVRLSGRRVLDACFLDNEYGYSLWNKAYRGDMARCAFAATEDETVPLGEDNYAYFVLRISPGRFAGFQVRRCTAIAMGPASRAMVR